MTALAHEAMPVMRPMTTGLYTDLPPAERYIHRTRDGALIDMLRRHGVETLPGRRIVELGCGDGSLLRTLVYFGAQPELLDAVDVDPKRVARAHTSLPDISISIADMACLPYEDDSFDLAFAFTSFSSVVDLRARRRGAVEAMRVLRRGGLLVVYDFQTNPTNSHVRPLPEREVRHMFESYPLDIQRVTLAPPLVRLLRGRRTLCRRLERLPFLRTHLLAAVRKDI